MYIFIEAWTPTRRWLDASGEERSAFMAGVGGAMEALAADGVEPLAWCENDQDTPRREDAAFFAVWRTPDLDVQRRFEQAIADSGWYDYFEHRNLRGLGETPQAVIARHVGG